MEFLGDECMNGKGEGKGKAMGKKMVWGECWQVLALDSVWSGGIIYGKVTRLVKESSDDGL